MTWTITAVTRTAISRRLAATYEFEPREDTPMKHTSVLRNGRNHETGEVCFDLAHSDTSEIGYSYHWPNVSRSELPGKLVEHCGITDMDNLKRFLAWKPSLSLHETIRWEADRSEDDYVTLTFEACGETASAILDTRA